MRRLLVTGGAGFIGTNFVRYWRSHHPDDIVSVIDALTYAGNLGNLEGLHEVEFFKEDIGNFAAVFELIRKQDIDTIVNFAAETHVDRSISSPDAFIGTNVTATHRLLRAAKAAWLDEGHNGPHRFHHISTDEVYGSLLPDDPPFDERAPYAPNSPYSASKAASDHLVRAYHRTYGLNATITNCSNNYGPYQFPEKLIPLFLTNIVRGKPLPIYGDGFHIRDWLHVEDHCRGIELVLEHGIPGETYNIGAGMELANVQVVDTLCRLVDEVFKESAELRERFPAAPAAGGERSVTLKIHVPDRPGHDRRYAINASKIEAELGFRPQFLFEDGLAQTVDWYLHNQRWWTAIIDGSYRRHT